MRPEESVDYTAIGSGVFARCHNAIVTLSTYDGAEIAMDNDTLVALEKYRAAMVKEGEL